MTLKVQQENVGGRAARAASRADDLARALRQAQRRLAAAGVEDAALEAELLLAHAMGLSRAQLLARLGDSLPAGRHSTYERLVAQRVAREPLPYITGHAEFYGLDFLCTPDALIPRPETELLVDQALAWVKDQGSGVKTPTVVDVGTGCGAIAVALAVHAPYLRIVAVDSSAAALRLARRNAERHRVDGRIDFVRGSLLDAARRPIDLILANLPYIPARIINTLEPEVCDHEPRAALVGGERGTELIEGLLSQSAGLLAPGGLLLAEHDHDQGASLRAAARAAFAGARIETLRDLAGYERVLAVAA
jgi:release factor glutamine methyltransferase